MNYGIILYMLGWILKTEGILMLVPVLTAVDTSSEPYHNVKWQIPP